MPLAAGTRLGPYEVLDLIGRGGMGEVYRARDTRLNRDVALKVLPSGVADSPIRRARFEREARAISQISHPHICAIHDVGEDQSVAYLVMEYIRGESLEERLRRGPIPWRTAVAWSIQMASAIEAAHRRGTVHRDLKPANVMIGETGVKLLDFGLAKLLIETETPSAADLSSTTSLTGEQNLVGTIRYMAPEQLEGRAVDQRTDIFAFGTTLYEMLTGRRAFDGTSTASITAAILTVDPPVASASASNEVGFPPALDHVVGRALAKDPDDRWQTARDVMIELQWIHDGRLAPADRPARRASARLVLLYALFGATVALLAAGTWISWSAQRPAATYSEEATVFEISPPAGMVFTPGYGLLAVSPDARKIAFLAGPRGGPYGIYVRDRASPEARPLPNTARASNMFWSPDSQSIGYFNSSSQLVRVNVFDGTQTVLTDIPTLGKTGGNPTGLWRTDGTILLPRPDGLHAVSASGGRLTQLSSEDLGQFPALLPDGRFLTHVRNAALDDSRLLIRAFDRALNLSLPVHSNAVFAEGHLVYRDGSALVARPFDERALRFSGQPMPLAQGIQYNPANERTVFDVSGDLLAYRLELPPKLVWRGHDGRVLGSVGETGLDWNPAIAPDGSGRIAIDRFEPATSRFYIATIDIDGRVVPLTHGLRERFALWSPDSRWIAYWGGAPQAGLHRTPSDGTGQDEMLLRSDVSIPVDWSPDGKYILYQTALIGDLWALPLAEPRTPLRVTPASGPGRSARFSPDGLWVAYTVDNGGLTGVWVQAFPSGEPRRQVAINGVNPMWRRDQKELYYMTSDGSLVALPIATGATVTTGMPAALFRISLGNLNVSVHPFATSPDGQRFLMTELLEGASPITVMLNWTALVR